MGVYNKEEKLMYKVKEAPVANIDTTKCSCGTTLLVGVFSRSLLGNVANVIVHCDVCGIEWLLTENIQLFSG